MRVILEIALLLWTLSCCASFKLERESNPCELFPCHESARCYGSRGYGHRCVCKEGFWGDGKDCTIKTPCKKCPEHARCRPFFWTYRCKCNEGYSWDDRKCQAHDHPAMRRMDDAEIARTGCNDKHACPANSVCQPSSVSGFTCVCDDGYYLDKRECVRVQPVVIKAPKPLTSLQEESQHGAVNINSSDPCSSHPCHEFAYCHNGKDSYRCYCIHGYIGNGRSCRRLNECDFRPCSKNALCTLDEDDSAVCRCRSGFRGNGVVCKAHPKKDWRGKR